MALARAIAKDSQAVFLDEPLANLDYKLREELRALPWVKDARVSVQLPSTLAIDIVEREPHAVLEKPDRLRKESGLNERSERHENRAGPHCRCLIATSACQLAFGRSNVLSRL